MNVITLTQRYRLFLRSGADWPARKAAEDAIRLLREQLVAILEPRYRRGEFSLRRMLYLERWYRWREFAKAFARRLDYVVEER